MHYHLIGIGGTSMAGIAKVLRAQGHTVSGSDALTTGHGAQLIPDDTDVVIYTDAVTPGSAGYEELAAAKLRRLTVLRRIDFIGQMMHGKTSVAVSGAHGKSTTTALIGWALTASGRDPTVFIGADLPTWQGSGRAGQGSYVVTEACEWNRQFLALHPTVLVVTTIDREHLDSYPGGLPEIRAAFRQAAAQVEPAGFIVANADDRNVREALRGIDGAVRWVGRTDEADYRVRFAETTHDGFLGISLALPGTPPLYLASPLVGEHHALNVALATAVLHGLGLSASELQSSLSSFPGLARRFERYRGDEALVVVDDYAHHPAEIAATLVAARQCYPGRRLVVVFQPHLSQRTTQLFSGFVEALSLAQLVFVVDTYDPVGRGTRPNERSSADLVRGLAQRLVAAEASGSLDQTLATVRPQLLPGDVVLTIGATAVWQVARSLVREKLAL